MSATETQVSVLYGIKDLRTEKRTVPPPASGELQVSVRATGLCGSDLHYYQHHRNGDILVREPLSLGHESAGVVEAIGDGVTEGSFKVGDRVALEVGIPCNDCDRCGEGRYNLCKRMNFRSSAKAFPHFQGTLQERINHPAVWCHRLPDNVTLDEGALLEPLSVAIHAVRRAQSVAGITALVLGAGAVGALTAAMLRVKGASTIVIADIEPRRVNFAVQNGFADRGFQVPLRRGSTIEEKLAIARETAVSVGQTLGPDDQAPSEGEFDAVFECTGVEACLQTAIYATRPGGKVLLIGMGTPIQTLPISAAALREVDLVGVFRYASTYQYGISALSSRGESTVANGADGGKGEEGVTRSLPDLSKLITHRFQGLDYARDAFELAGKGVDVEGKLVMKVFIETGTSL